MFKKWRIERLERKLLMWQAKLDTMVQVPIKYNFQIEDLSEAKGKVELIKYDINRLKGAK